MGCTDNLKFMCCTWEGLGRLKKYTAFVCGGMIITSSILTMLNLVYVLTAIRSIWNIIFGVIMIFIQLNWKSTIGKYFGFLKNWFLRGAFYVFVGTNTMHWGTGSNGDVTFWDFLSMCTGFACCFVGIIELLFGMKCAPEEEKDPEEGKAGGRHTVEPTLNVNLTPAQIAQGAQFAANNANTVAAVGNAAGNAAAAAPGTANPFFGNAHLNRN